MNKSCSKCKQIKPFSAFYKTSRTRSGYTPACRVCQSKTVNKIKAKNSKLFNTYGITLPQLAEFLDAQGNKCSICDKPETIRDARSGITRSLAVDHDHKTGIVRGALCSKCNRGIGMFNDNPNLLSNAINYLISFKEALEEHNAVV